MLTKIAMLKAAAATAAALLAGSALAGTKTYECVGVRADRAERATLEVRRSLFGALRSFVYAPDSSGVRFELPLGRQGLEDSDDDLLAEAPASVTSSISAADRAFIEGQRYRRLSDGGLLSATDYYYVSESIVGGEPQGALLVRDAYGCGPFPRVSLDYFFYSCARR